MIIGLFIFSTWWAARAFYAYDLNSFEAYGFFWIGISLFIAGLGLLLMIIVLIINLPKYLTKNLLGVLIILSNIPVVFMVVQAQETLARKAYIKFVNKTEHGNIGLALSSSRIEKQLGQIDRGNSKVIYFLPERSKWNYDYEPLILDPVLLTITSEDSDTTIALPDIFQGECLTLVIDEDLKLRKK